MNDKLQTARNALTAILDRYSPIFDNDSQADVDAYYEAKNALAMLSE